MGNDGICISVVPSLIYNDIIVLLYEAKYVERSENRNQDGRYSARQQNRKDTQNKVYICFYIEMNSYIYPSIYLSCLTISYCFLFFYFPK
jgi:hypothetical protein